PVPSYVAPPPPPIPHKVWILDCKSCGKFLTNRGMKAVLLLRPNVPLYSTDALPINCSAFSPSVDPAANQPPPARPSPPSSARSSLSSPSDPPSPTPAQERPPSRTCECLTQTLCCHGCGNAVGYMIVAPCQRCTSSITANNRATNGHRFVFYSSEITACKRHYVPGEPGVSAFHPQAPAPAPATVQNVQGAMANLQIAATSTPPRPAPGPLQEGFASPTSPTSPSMPALVPAAPRTTRRTSVDIPPTTSTSQDVVPTSPTSPGYLSPSALAARSRASSSSAQAPPRLGPESTIQEGVPPVPPNSHTTTPSVGSTPTFASPGLNGSPPTPSPVSSSALVTRARAASTSAALSLSPSNGSYIAHPLGFQAYIPRAPPHAQPQPNSRAQEQERERQPLKAGEVLYWHHLLRSGEIPAVFEDPRARMDEDAHASASAAEEAKRAQAEAAAAQTRRRMSLGARRVVAGR
ncbi:hypothetical protein C8Q77DRAFT_1042139, partial [Trametes polyzona]